MHCLTSVPTPLSHPPAHHAVGKCAHASASYDDTSCASSSPKGMDRTTSTAAHMRGGGGGGGGGRGDAGGGGGDGEGGGGDGLGGGGYGLVGGVGGGLGHPLYSVHAIDQGLTLLHFSAQRKLIL